MIEEKMFETTNWRTYLDPFENKRVERFLKRRGVDVLTGLVKSIDEALDMKSEKLMVLVHPNVSSLILILPNEYEEILNHCLNYFQTMEEYEMCAKTLSVIKKIKK